MSSAPEIRAVVFDLGGVVLGSPLHAIADFEARHGVPHNTINRHVMASAPDGAWHLLERGEIELGPDFYRLFDAELRSLGHELSSEEMMRDVRAISKPRPVMLDAIERLKSLDYKVGALTNNWKDADRGATSHAELRDRFDVFVESARLEMRKPDPRIYEHTCGLLAVSPREAAFLDDIGANLKSARALGMTTIKVVEPEQALAQLWLTLGVGRTEA